MGGIGDIITGAKPKAPPPPPKPATLPTIDDAAVQKAKQKSVAAQTQRSGRASTVLTSDYGLNRDKMGG